MDGALDYYRERLAKRIADEEAFQASIERTDAEMRDYLERERGMMQIDRLLAEAGEATR